MSITQTYFLAHKARAKLSHEAAQPDHNLRLLVGHANLLDSLMLDLADAEREQESWFNQSVRGATKNESRRVQWADTVVEEPEEDWQAEDADDASSSDSDSDLHDESDEEIDMTTDAPLRRTPSTKLIPVLTTSSSAIVEEDMVVDDEDFAHLALTRSPSHSSSPPELMHDSDSSDDESMPPSPPATILPTFSEKQKETVASTPYYDTTTEEKESFYGEGLYLPPRNPARLVSAISVY